MYDDELYWLVYCLNMFVGQWSEMEVTTRTPGGGHSLKNGV